MIQACAIIDPESGAVINVVVADPETHSPPQGQIMVPATANGAMESVVDSSWTWTLATGFVPPPSYEDGGRHG